MLTMEKKERRAVFAGLTDRGRVRENNEDNLLMDGSLNLFMVCDGMGGHNRGDVASRLATASIHEKIYKAMREISSSTTPDPSRGKALYRKILIEAIRYANVKILNEGKSNPECAGMGTTLSLLWFVGSTAFIAQIGDSRIYLYRDKELHLLTEDHSLFFELIRYGSMSLTDYQKFPYKNVITRALGVNLSVEADILELDILHNDIFILSTDGMHSLLNTDDIKEALSMPDLSSVARGMINKANALGGIDNITVVIANVPQNYEIPNSEEIKERYDVVSNVPVYRTLSLPERIKVVGMSDVLKLKMGDILFKEGEEGDGLYVVCNGSISVWRGKNPIARFTANTHFGEMSLIEPSMRLARAVADTGATVLLLKRREFFRLLKETPTLAAKLLWNLSTILTSRLKSINDELMLLKTCFDSGEIKTAGMPNHEEVK